MGSEIGAAIRHVAGYMTDDESQDALGRMVDALDERSGAIRRLKAQVDALEAENRNHMWAVEQLTKKLHDANAENARLRTLAAAAARLEAT